MTDASDMELLQDYGRRSSEEAFAEVVRRHINLVYSAALRHVAIPVHAEEITQAVFVILSRKANSLRPDTILDAWLYQTTRLTSLSFLRGERRRQLREQEAYMQAQLQEPTTMPVWNQIAPLLDEAMARLGQTDREAVVLRFFKEKSLGEVAVALNTTEAAAQSRVHRAVEKLQKYFLKRGIDSTTAAISGAISANSVQVAPAALAKIATTASLAKGTAASTSTLTLIKGALKLMAWTKMKTTIVAGAVILAAMGTGTVAVQQARRLYREHQVRWVMDLQALKKEPPVVMIRPAQPIPGVESGGGGYMGNRVTTSGNMIGLKRSVKDMLQLAYQTPADSDSGFAHADRFVNSVSLPRAEYDFISSIPGRQQEALQEALTKKFGLVARHEKRERDVLLITVQNPGAAGLKISDGSGGGLAEEQGHLELRGAPMSLLAGYIEDNLLGIPVLDRTGLTNTYDIDLTWPVKGRNWTSPNRETLKRILLEQLGLELVPGREPIEMLVVEKVR